MRIFAAYEGHSHPSLRHGMGHVIMPNLYISYQRGGNMLEGGEEEFGEVVEG